MAQFFTGKLNYASIEFWYAEGKGRLTCAVSDWWDTIDATASECGSSTEYALTKRIGLSRTDRRSLEATLESSLGVPKLVELKSKLSEVTHSEMHWEESKEESKSFSFIAPRCGKQTNIIYQMVRTFAFTNERIRVFRRSESWQVQIHERLPFFDARSNPEPWIEACKCDPSPSPEFDGVFNLDLGKVSLQVPFNAVTGGIRLHFSTGVVGDVDTDTVAPQEIRLVAKRLPEVVLWLGDITEWTVTGILRPSALPSFVPIGEVEVTTVSGQRSFKERPADAAG